MAEFDLTTKLGTYLDRHLVFPLLEFLSNKQIYDEKEMLQGKLDLLSNTNMLDLALDLHRQLYGTEDEQALKDKRAEVVKKLKKFQTDTEELFKILTEDSVAQQIQSARDGRQLNEFLTQNYNFKAEMMEILYDFAKFQYECGNYSGAADYLNIYRILVPQNDKNYLNSLWGKLASEILMQNWEAALEDLNRLKEYIELTNFGSSLQSLQQRSWLIHWSLFVFFNHTRGRDLIIDMFLYQQQYLNAIQTICPHILRYLASAVITNKFKRAALKDLVKVIQQESYTYRDPITEFIEHLYVNFDFDAAQQKLRECEEVICNDFFLVACLDDFIDNARLMIFETFCRIHQCISINMLAEKLNMTPEEAERWIVNLIRNARLDAKIDSRLGHVVMGTQAVSPYDQLIEKTKNLAFKAQQLSQNIEKRLNINRNQDLSSHWGAHDF